jgi:hypothetical protein
VTKKQKRARVQFIENLWGCSTEVAVDIWDDSVRGWMPHGDARRVLGALRSGEHPGAAEVDFGFNNKPGEVYVRRRKPEVDEKGGAQSGKPPDQLLFSSPAFEGAMRTLASTLGSLVARAFLRSHALE